MKDIAQAIRTKMISGTPALVSGGVFVGYANETPGTVPFSIWSVIYLIGGDPVLGQDAPTGMRTSRIQISVFGRGGDGRREYGEAETIRQKLIYKVWRDTPADVWVQSVVPITETAFIRDDTPEVWHAAQDFHVRYV